MGTPRDNTVGQLETVSVSPFSFVSVRPYFRPPFLRPLFLISKDALNRLDPTGEREREREREGGRESGENIRLTL